MTNPTPHGQVPEALLHASYLESIFVSEEMSSSRACRIAKELRRLHAYCQELESQFIRDCMTHDQKPAEIEHVAGDVSKNGTESNMSTQQPAPATQPPSKQASKEQTMTDPTDAELLALIEKHLGFKPRRDDTVIDPRTGRFHDVQRYRDMKADILAKWGTPPAVAGEPIALLVRKNSWRDGQWEAAPPNSPFYGLAWAHQRVYVCVSPQPVAEVDWIGASSHHLMQKPSEVKGGTVPSVPICQPMEIHANGVHAAQHCGDARNEERPIMTNQQGAPEALRPIQRFNNIVGLMNPEARGLYVRYEDHVAALVEAQQPDPSAAAASKAVLAAIRAANMQLVRTGDDAFMLVTFKQATPQADSQDALEEAAQLVEKATYRTRWVKAGVNGQASNTQPCALAAALRKLKEDTQ